MSTQEPFKKPKPGSVLEAEIDGITVKGQGVSRYGDYRVLVRGAVPGDRVVARMRKVRHRKKEVEARPIERLGETVSRQDPSCDHFGLCGGCLWQDLPYASQLELKTRMVLEALRPGDDVEIAESLAAPSPLAYRNKMEFSIGEGESGEFEIGLHPSGRFGQIFDLERCDLVRPVVSEIVSFVREFARSEGLTPYDLREHTGLLRFLTIREGTQTGDLMVILTTSEEPFPTVSRLGSGLTERFPRVRSVIHTINREKAQVAFGQESEVVAGRQTITDKLGPFHFDISPTSFFQPNTMQAERMFARVVELAELDTADRVLDAYCGTGGISLFLSQAAGSVVGVEASEDAIRDAVRNSADNEVVNCEFMAGPAEDLLGQLCRQGEEFDVAVTDPPRAGMHHRATRGLIDLRPDRIVYVSCNPAALAQDAGVLSAHGYRMDYVQLVDMLPQTPHCEVLVRLRRA